MSHDAVDIRPLSGHLGAELEGLDLSKPLEQDTFEFIRRALLDNGVLAIRDQRLGHAEQIALARRFGEPEVHPIAVGMEDHPELIRVHKPAGESACFGTGWHTDNTFFERPSMVTVLYGVKIPPHGGDTLFTSTERAFETLSATMQGFVAGLDAVHSASRAYDPKITGEAKYRGEAAINYRMSEAIYEEVVHPVVRTNPDSGRKSLFVNPMFTQRIVGLSAAESDAVLQFLFAHIVTPDFTCRVRWEPGTLVLWDNRATQHYALDDYQPFERLMYRVTIRGERPV
jgi:taurine dioxygenase